MGIVMCLEQLRYDSIRRMASQVYGLVGGSCWRGFTPEYGKRTHQALVKKYWIPPMPYLLKKGYQKLKFMKQFTSIFLLIALIFTFTRILIKNSHPLCRLTELMTVLF